jgi:hypothetical protein
MELLDKYAEQKYVTWWEHQEWYEVCACQVSWVYHAWTCKYSSFVLLFSEFRPILYYESWRYVNMINISSWVYLNKIYFIFFQTLFNLLWVFQSASIFWQLTKFDEIRKSVGQLRYNFINIFLQGHKSIFVIYSTPLRPTNGTGNVACFIFKKESRFCNVLKRDHFSTLDSKIGSLVQLPHIHIVPVNFPSMLSSI